MTSIFLHDTDENNSYGRSGKITKEEYLPCQLFMRYEHKSTKPLSAQTVYVYKKYNSGLGRYLTLKHNGYYSKHGLDHEHVYFNKYEKKTALLFVLFFKDDGPNPRHRFYKRSRFDSEIDRAFRRWIDNLFPYKNYMGEQQLLIELLKENDMIDDLLTYQIDKKGIKNYNSGKIKLQLDSKTDSQLSRSGFIKYNHMPEIGNNNKKGCVLYNNNVLMGKDGKPIEILQHITYDYISVYWSNEVDVPFLIKFKENNSIKYYFQKKDDRGLYWQLLDQSSYQETLGQTVQNNQIHNRLNNTNYSELSKLLEGLKSNLDKTLVFMIERQTSYQKGEVTSLFKEQYKNRLINKEVKVTKATHNVTCLQKYGFEVYEHDFGNSVETTRNEELVHMKFFIPNTDTCKYNQLKLFKDSITNVYRSNKYGSNKVYVYFYGDDPRPLMFCYNDEFYLPYDEDRYVTEWVNVPNIKQYVCNFDGKSEGLLAALTQVVWVLNTVKLEEKPDVITQPNEKANDTGKQEHIYTLQTFNGNKIEIKVTYWNLNCYRVYTHEPVGIRKKGGRFRLGNVKYGNNILLYSSYEPLTSVQVYYSLYDYDHEHPLLVTLEFKNNDRTYKEYYKQISKEMIMWQKVDVDLDKIEYTAHGVRRDLEITYTEEDKTRTLFSPEKCEESDNNTIIEASVGTVSAVGAAGGIGFGVFKYYGSVLAFFRGLF